VLGRQKRLALDGLEHSRPSTEDLTIFIPAFARADFYVKDAAICLQQVVYGTIVIRHTRHRLGRGGGGGGGNDKIETPMKY